MVPPPRAHLRGAPDACQASGPCAEGGGRVTDAAVRTDPTAQSRTAVGIGLVLLSAFFFAASGPFAKAMYADGWTPGAVVLLRLLGCALVLLVPTLVALRGRWQEALRGWRTVVSYGLVSMAGVQLLYFLAVEHLAVAVAL